MDHGQLSMVADKCQWVFSESLLNACGTEAKFCPDSASFAISFVPGADGHLCQPARRNVGRFHRGFNALWGTTIT